MAHWHVRVTPDPDEAERVDHEQERAALAYLKAREADGRYSRCKAWRGTGGYIELEASGPEEILAGLADYPLRDTITLEIIEMAGSGEDLGDSLDEGFAVLAANIDAARPGPADRDAGHDRAAVDH